MAFAYVNFVFSSLLAIIHFLQHKVHKSCLIGLKRNTSISRTNLRPLPSIPVVLIYYQLFHWSPSIQPSPEPTTLKFITLFPVKTHDLGSSHVYVFIWHFLRQVLTIRHSTVSNTSKTLKWPSFTSAVYI